MDSIPTTAIPRKETASAAELLLVFPQFGDNAKFMLIVLCRAFGIDNRVALLNVRVDWKRDWPEPYLLSKLIRCISYPLKRCWLVTKKTLSDLGYWVRSHVCVSSHTVNAEGAAESGERSRRDTAEVVEEDHSPGPAEKSKNEFRRSLQKVFSNKERVDRIMELVGTWEDTM